MEPHCWGDSEGGEQTHKMKPSAGRLGMSLFTSRSSGQPRRVRRARQGPSKVALPGCGQAAVGVGGLQHCCGALRAEHGQEGFLSL